MGAHQAARRDGGTAVGAVRRGSVMGTCLPAPHPLANAGRTITGAGGTPALPGAARATSDAIACTIAQSDDYVSGRIERVDLDTGTVEVLYGSCDGRPLKGPNDIVFDRSGGFWFIDFGKVREHEIDRGGVYYARRDGSLVREAVHPFLTANGIGLPPDETIL